MVREGCPALQVNTRKTSAAEQERKVERGATRSVLHEENGENQTGGTASQVRSTISHGQFAGEKRLGITAGSVAFHPTQAHKGEKCLFLKPVFGTLGSENRQKMAHFPFEKFRLKGNKQVWLPKVTIVFRNLIFENHVVSKGIPR